MCRMSEKALGQSQQEVLSHTEVIDYYLRKERQWDFFKRCIIVKLNGSLWLINGIIVIKEGNLREGGEPFDSTS